MDVITAVLQRRSIRRFTQEPIPQEALRQITEAARLAPTTRNQQPLQFAVITGNTLCHNIFPHTMWARLIPDGSAGPDENTQPTAYIAILIDRRVAPNAEVDAGAAGMSILLAATSLGVASCWLGSVARAEVMDLLALDSQRFALHTLVALGYPAMEAKAVPMKTDETAYYLESKDVLCVPKRAADAVIQWYTGENEPG